QQLATGSAFALAHGLLPLPAGAAPTKHRTVAILADAAVLLEFDGEMNSRVSRVSAHGTIPLTHWGASDYLALADGTHAARFALQTHERLPVDGIHGPGARLTLRGRAARGIEKTVAVELFQRYPGFVFWRVAYRNLSPAPLNLQGWTNDDFLVREAAAGTPAFWSYSGGSYADRRDWVQPVRTGFAQDNFMGMSAPDYGSGTPVVDVWRRDGGLAVGHLEASPKLVSLPVQEESGRVRVAVCSRHKAVLASGERFETLQTFVAVHAGDYFATLSAYRRIMADTGLKSPDCGPACYQSIWCAWGYERECTTALIEGTLPKVKDLGLEWAVIDDGWQSTIGDWRLDKTKYPRGDADMTGLVDRIKTAGLRPRLWYSPLSVAPGADLLHEHPDMLLLDKDGAPQIISWWNSFYLCPAYAMTIGYTQGLIRRFIGDWGFAGLKIDGQHLNGVAPCFNPAHHHARPEESVEGLQNFFRAIYETAIGINPDAVIELCPCGTAYSVFNFPYMNQAPASDPETSWQVRLKGKTLKALMGPSAPYAGDHVELSDHGDDFASTIGVGGIVSTKFTWPVDPKPKDSFLLTPEKEHEWRRWIAIYKDKMLPRGVYRGDLYDIGFDRPEAHVVEKSGALYYAFYAARWQGDVELRGLGPGTYRVRDYFHDRDLGTLCGGRNRLTLAFDRFLLLEASPA
ncbi:MAG: alpha-galactosidase, partial [Pseudomonadota bacterium]|nr:alpha-galactosidase [Pseudomonadota bacterium]